MVGSIREGARGGAVGPSSARRSNPASGQASVGLPRLEQSLIEPDLPHKITAIAAALSAAQLDFAFGGALALAYYAEPRTTVDIDINVFLPPEEHDRLAK